MNRRSACWVARVAAAAAVALARGAAAGPSFPDTLGAWTPTAEGGAFDVVPRADYLRHRAFTLDHFLEFSPGGVVVRAGPIGNDAAYSRWGIGRGRASLSLNGIPYNDPISGVAPWVHTATSGAGRLEVDAGARAPSWIEGGVALVEAPPAKSRPATFIELSKGTHEVRQRRVRFGSEEGRLGIDLSYDEVLDDGYGFDAGGIVPDQPDYGKSRSRNSAVSLRGAPDDRARFTFGFRQFESTTTGDLTSATAEGRRDGHLVWLDTEAGGARVTVYGRGFSNAYPDSESVSETTGGALEVGAGGAAREVRVRVGAEETSFTQIAGGGRSSGRLAGGSALVSARSAIGGNAEVFASGSTAADEEGPLAWGAAVGIRRTTPRQLISAQAGRSARVPTLHERFAPAHLRGGMVLAGDADLDVERALEARADWEQRAGPLVNRVRASWIEVGDGIAFRPRLVGVQTWRLAANSAERQSMRFLEERLRAEFRAGGLRALAEGAVVFSSGDREEVFAGVPKLHANASLLVGGEMFEATSAAYVGAEYLHMDERVDYHGRALPGFDVLNLVLEARLLGARFYLKYLNLLDERYTTLGDYLMTPRTFVYGIEWTLFD